MAVNVAVLALAAIVTVAGIVSTLAMPPLSVTATGVVAALLNVTVQDAAPFDVSVPGLHANDESVVVGVVLSPIVTALGTPLKVAATVAV